MRTLDGYLSRKARSATNDQTAVVYKEADGTFTLERGGRPPLGLGATFSAARQALAVLRTPPQ